MMCVWIIVEDELFSVLLSRKITIGLVRDNFSDQRLKIFARICGHYVAKRFISIFVFEDLYFVSPYDHLTELNFLFYFEP